MNMCAHCWKANVFLVATNMQCSLSRSNSNVVFVRSYVGQMWTGAEHNDGCAWTRRASPARRWCMVSFGADSWGFGACLDRKHVRYVDYNRLNEHTVQSFQQYLKHCQAPAPSVLEIREVVSSTNENQCKRISLFLADESKTYKKDAWTAQQQHAPESPYTLDSSATKCIYNIMAGSGLQNSVQYCESPRQPPRPMRLAQKAVFALRTVSNHAAPLEE